MNTPTTIKKIIFLAGINHDNGTHTKYAGEKYRQFREAYQSILNLFSLRHVEVYFAEIDHLCMDGSFSAYYTVERVTDGSDGAIIFKKMTDSIHPDLVVNRMKDALYHHPVVKSRPWKIYNEYEIAQYGNKSISQQTLSEFMPSSLTVDTDALEGDAVEAFMSRHNVAVMKPLRLNGGQGIELAHSSDEVWAYFKRNDSHSMVLQEFIETAAGAPGLSSERHDIRLYVIDGRVQMMAIRKPQAGEFLANTAAGGSIEFYGTDAVPSELCTLLETIMGKLNSSVEHYFISLDFFYGNNQWYLIEVNDQPGVPAHYQTDQSAKLHESLVSSIMEYVS